MNNEKNNLWGSNSDLPSMGTVVNNNVANNTVDKFNLPPISTFTNFDNNDNVNNNVNNNVSVFDLMDEFESVNTGNNIINSQSMVNNTGVNNSMDVFNSMPNQNIGIVNHAETNVNPKALNPAFAPNQSMQQSANNIPVVESQPITFNTPDEAIAQSVQSAIPLSEQTINPLTFNAPNQPSQQSANNIPVVETPSQPITFNATDEAIAQSVQSTIPLSEQTVNPLTFNAPNQVTQQSANNIPIIETPSQPITFNTVSESINKPAINISTVEANQIQPISNPALSSDQINAVGQVSVNNNVSIDEQQINSIAEDVLKQANLNNHAFNNEYVDVLKNQKTESLKEVKKEKKPKKKKKLLLIIILVISFLIIGASLVLCYFMFFKTDKLVCEYQDYSSEDFLLTEVMTINFKGRQMSDAKFEETLNFTETGLEKKETYQADLQNQFDGMGFNVTYSEIVDGFEITMDFTKENLANWTGTEIKSATKENLLREMKNSGYTCK